jgi:CheY-like chemotaxis protein
MSRKTLLHVDDNPDDLFLFKKACSQGASFNLKSFDSGQQAMNYLQGLREYSDRTKFPLPHLVLLDLKMPPPDGFAVLHWIRNQLQFSQINICLLTSSFQYQDIQKAYAEGANWFLTKPATLDRLIAIATALDHCLVTSDYGPLKELAEFRN